MILIYEWLMSMCLGLDAYIYTLYSGVQNRFYSEQPYTIHEPILIQGKLSLYLLFCACCKQSWAECCIKNNYNFHCDNPSWRVPVWGIQEANAMSNRLRNFLSTTFLILKNLRIWSQYKILLWKKQLTSSFEGEMDTPWTDKVTSQFYFILCCLTLIVRGVVCIHNFF